MENIRNPIHCFIPPHVVDHLSQSDDPKLRRVGIANLKVSVAARERRSMFGLMPRMAAIPSPKGKKRRVVYDMKHREFPLPGKLVREEGDKAVSDSAVNEAYDYAGATYDFYNENLERNSLDGNGMTLVSIVHYGDKISNAFWDGEQMLYGDGDGELFLSFTKSIEVVGHELTHGVVQYTSNLVYQDEPGALNEHFADAMSLLVEQWYKDQTVKKADWWLGGELLAPIVGAKGIRTFTEEKAYEDNPYLGTDPQPKHYKDKYTGPQDNGGVHINSGIPNHAFYRVAMELGGNAWKKAGVIWYKTLIALNQDSNFQEAAEMTYMIATKLYGQGSNEQKAVRDGWKAVGISV
jgi:Zn-dependent metalloprotease